MLVKFFRFNDDLFAAVIAVTRLTQHTFGTTEHMDYYYPVTTNCNLIAVMQMHPDCYVF